MIDYLFSFASEADAHAALDPLGFGFPAGPDGEGGTMPARWDGSRLLPVQIGVGKQPLVGVTATVAGVDAQANVLPDYAPIYAQGFWLAVSTKVPNDALYALAACMREADRARALAGQPYVLRERFTAQQLASPWWVTPQWCGVNYSNKGIG